MVPPTGTGAWTVDWGSGPVRSSPTRERPDAPTPGTCGTCKACCTTSWLPEAERLYCPFLGKRGCRIYGGVYWDHFNCGRYPYTPAASLHYDCPRFERPVTIPDALPATVGRPEPVKGHA